MRAFAMRRGRNFVALAFLAFSAACDWISLAANALTYDTVARGEAANLWVEDSIAYVTLGDAGMALADTRSGRVIGTLPPVPGSESVDDIAIAGSMLFALDAREPGHLTAFSIADARRPARVSVPVVVPVGPFSGVSARGGVVVVSGGTGVMTFWSYDSTGIAGGPFATADLGRGQPDVLLDATRPVAFVSTHYWGPYFGIDIIRLQGASAEKIGRIELKGAGFTAGGSKPANFPISAAQLNDSTLLVAFARGLAVIDIARLDDPRLRQVLEIGKAVHVHALAPRAVVTIASPSPEIAIVDFSETAPRVMSRTRLQPGTIPSAAMFSADRIVVAARGRGVLVVPP